MTIFRITAFTLFLLFTASAVLAQERDDEVKRAYKEMLRKIDDLSKAHQARLDLLRQQLETQVADRDVALAKLTAENAANAEAIVKWKALVVEKDKLITEQDVIIVECRRTIFSLIAENKAINHKFVLRFGRAFKRVFRFQFD